MKKTITFCGIRMDVSCDENCEKAWGINSRPIKPKTIGDKNQVDNKNGNIDLDNIIYYSDDELGTAPIDPGTIEGGDCKPINKIGIPNRWCVKECERCESSPPKNE